MSLGDPIIQRSKKISQRLYSNNNATNNLQENQTLVHVYNFPSDTTSEIRYAINKMKNNKAPG